jgi:hypothetical protein
MTDDMTEYIESELFDLLMDHSNKNDKCFHLTKCEATAIVFTAIDEQLFDDFVLCERNYIFARKLQPDKETHKLFIDICDGETPKTIELVPCDQYTYDPADHECDACLSCERFKQRDTVCGKTKTRTPTAKENEWREDGKLKLVRSRNFFIELEKDRLDYNLNIQKGDIKIEPRPRSFNLLLFGTAYIRYFNKWKARLGKEEKDKDTNEKKDVKDIFGIDLYQGTEIRDIYKDKNSWEIIVSKDVWNSNVAYLNACIVGSGEVFNEKPQHESKAKPRLFK